MDSNRQQIVAKVQKLLNLAEGERKLGNIAAANTAKGMADKLVVKHSVTEIEIKGTNYTFKQTTSTSQNKNYASAEEAVKDIFSDIFGTQQKSSSSREYRDYHSWNDERGKKQEKTYRYRQAFSYGAQHRNDVKRTITAMIIASGTDIEEYETDVKEKSFFGNPKTLTTRFSVTGTEAQLLRFKHIFLTWMENN